MVPLQVAASAALGLSPAQTSSLLCSVWLTGALATFGLSLAYRQPVPITWNTAALVYLVAVSSQFSLPELFGANVLAGLITIVLGVLGFGRRLLVWLPLPITMGMFAGSVLGEMTRLVTATIADGIVVGTAGIGYLLGRSVKRLPVPPLGLAVGAGAAAALLTHSTQPAPVAWSLPTLTVPPMAISVPAFVGVTLPLIVLALGLGNLQGLGFLRAQGYDTPATAATLAVGATWVASALLGGHPTNVSRFGVAVLAGTEAGPPRSRYWACLIAAGLMLLIALAAGPVTSLLASVPQSFVVALAGLAIFSSFQEALSSAFSGDLRFGATVAFLVAATSFTVAGLPSACWALAAGLGAAMLTERTDLRAHWRGAATKAAT